MKVGCSLVGLRRMVLYMLVECSIVRILRLGLSLRILRVLDLRRSGEIGRSLRALCGRLLVLTRSLVLGLCRLFLACVGIPELEELLLRKTCTIIIIMST